VDVMSGEMCAVSETRGIYSLVSKRTNAIDFGHRSVRAFTNATVSLKTCYRNGNAVGLVTITPFSDAVWHTFRDWNIYILLLDSDGIPTTQMAVDKSSGFRQDDNTLDSSSTVRKTLLLIINDLRRRQRVLALHFHPAGFSVHAFSLRVGGTATPAAMSALWAWPRS